MLKKRIIAVLSLILLPATIIYGQTTTANIDKSQLNNGIVNISYKSENNKTTKVVITKGSDKYTYDLKSNGQFPLQFGDGEYTVSILENAIDNKYKVIKNEKVNLKATNANAVFLQSTEIINWNENMNAIKIAKQLTKDSKTDKEKVTAIYDYITKNIKYDYKKASSVAVGYIPSIDATLKTLQGICYDYSVLLASMLRSVGIPTKMIMGYENSVEGYHAWNEVYLKETNEWVTIDTTYDAIKVQNNIATPMIKNSSEYRLEKQY